MNTNRPSTWRKTVAAVCLFLALLIFLISVKDGIAPAPTPEYRYGQLAAIIGVPALFLGLALFFYFLERAHQRRDANAHK